MKIEVSAHARLRALERLNINREDQLEALAQKAMRTTNGIPKELSGLSERFYNTGLEGNIIKVFEGTIFIFCKAKDGLILKTIFLHKALDNGAQKA